MHNFLGNLNTSYLPRTFSEKVFRQHVWILIFLAVTLFDFNISQLRFGAWYANDNFSILILSNRMFFFSTSITTLISSQWSPSYLRSLFLDEFTHMDVLAAWNGASGDRFFGGFVGRWRPHVNGGIWGFAGAPPERQGAGNRCQM